MIQITLTGTTSCVYTGVIDLDSKSFWSICKQQNSAENTYFVAWNLNNTAADFSKSAVNTNFDTVLNVQEDRDGNIYVHGKRGSLIMLGRATKDYAWNSIS